ncbi:hypothetical protein ACQFX9_16485 [Aliinostoc sp. HNIBRCY26]|uniref:hypothetical protein n=1 Tax=Aliinostoc sp. HNIBRCY26 TaxID=3418997 RepID=UPI003CFF74DE
MVKRGIYQRIVMNILITILIIMAIIAIMQNSEQFLSQWRSFQINKPRGRVSHTYRSDPKNRYLQRDLLILLKGDTAAAKRLLAQQRRKQPGKSDNWYLEKVIFDLERDRRF